MGDVMVALTGHAMARRNHVHGGYLRGRHLVKGTGRVVVGGVDTGVVGGVRVVGCVHPRMVGRVRRVDARVGMIRRLDSRVMPRMGAGVEPKAWSTKVIHIQWQLKLRVWCHETRRRFRHGGCEWLAPRHTAGIGVVVGSVGRLQHGVGSGEEGMTAACHHRALRTVHQV